MSPEFGWMDWSWATEAGLSIEDIRALQILQDPVAFAEAHFGWKARDYQADILRDPSLRKLVRAGRRIGKCVAQGSMVMTEKGPLAVEKLLEAERRPAIATFNERTQKLEMTSEYFVWSNGRRPVFRLTTRTGRINVATSNHPYYVKQKGKAFWVDLGNLEIGQKIAVPTKTANEAAAERYCQAGIVWDEIVSIEPMGEAETYDLNVPGTHTLVADDIVSHNSEIIAIKCIWYSFTRGQDSERPGSRGHACLIITPYEEQITAIFTRIRELIALSPEIQASVKQDKQNPQTIVFHNGSYIKGYTAGTKSGSEAAGVRGQRADWIFLDEADYLSEGDVNSVVAIALEDPKIGIWASSTPSGRRQHFYRWHLNASLPDEHPDKRWKEWHFPSTVIPSWGPAMEKEFRDIFTTDVAYVREVLADWGEEASGVYPPPLVESAVEDYAYTAELDYHALRMIGVDWDKFQATPEIVVLEHKLLDDGDHIFEIVYRETIPRTKFTLDYTVERIVELDHLFSPAFVYVDRGYGDYQVERLQIIGTQAAPGEKGHGLNKRVKGIQFRQTIELREPGTGKMIKRDAKSLMVAMTRFLLERHALRFSSHDSTLFRQMLDYSSHVTPYGNVRYAPGRTGDHVLDALHLCVLGFAIEFPHLLEIQRRPDVVRKMGRSSRPLIPEHRPSRSWSMPSQQPQGQELEQFVSPFTKEEQSWRRVSDLREALRERRGEGGSGMFPTWGPRGSRRIPRRRSF